MPAVSTTNHTLERALKAAVRGDVRFDAQTRAVYATDASIYEIPPVGVVLPRDQSDVREVVRIAREFGASLLPRGGGTSLSGQTAGHSIVLDFTRYMNAILEVNPEERWARVQPGVIHGELNERLAPHGLQLAPDPATSNRASIGGMIGNNSAGTRSIRYGRTIDHVIDTRVMLPDGDVVTFGPLDARAVQAAVESGSREGRIYEGLRRIVSAHAPAIRERFPKVMRRVSGYNLDFFVDRTDWNGSHLIVGSEGTLATLLEARVNLEPLPAASAIAILHFDDLLGAIRAVPDILSRDPSAVEILDDTLIRLALGHPTLASQCDFIEGTPAAVLIVEFQGEDASAVADRVRAFARDMAKVPGVGAVPVRTDAAGCARVWHVRKSGLGIMLSATTDRKPIPFIEDACVPVEKLASYIERILSACRKLDVDVAMYAHASVGVIHVRPVLDLRRAADIALMKRISEHALGLVMEYGGSWSGEHGDGLVRSPLLERFFGEEVYGAFRETKALFDPDHRMNPGKIVDAEPMDAHLRYGADYRVEERPTVYRFREFGSMTAAVDLCSGVGACRKTTQGTMCPSYIATRDEVHTTRGRANLLRLAMNGRLGVATLADEIVKGALDLCLSCKACKAECPSRVDMARLKGEFLQHHHDAHGASLRDRLVAASPDVARRAAGPFAPLVNALQGNPLSRALLDRFAGLDRRRPLPAFSRTTLRRWAASRARPPARGRPVALFVDTYADAYEPEVGQAAVRLLESFGYDVELADVGCCQRPRLSHGFLREAAERGGRTLRGLDAFLSRDVPVVVCEPSCASALVDDLPDLIDDTDLAERVRNGVTTIDLFLSRALAAGDVSPPGRAAGERILIHGHCHQKALFGVEGMRALFEAVPGVRVEVLDAGCCGMAGSFGYEREHADVSRKVAADRLLPALADAGSDTVVVADGFSCRHQIRDLAGRTARHWVQALTGPLG